MLIDETQELIEKQQALINCKIELQSNINLLNKRMAPITNHIFELEQQLDKIRGIKNAGETRKP
jgi:prefoldin subunit 5